MPGLPCHHHQVPLLHGRPPTTKMVKDGKISTGRDVNGQLLNGAALAAHACQAGSPYDMHAVEQRAVATGAKNHHGDFGIGVGPRVAFDRAVGTWLKLAILHLYESPTGQGMDLTSKVHTRMFHCAAAKSLETASTRHVPQPVILRHRLWVLN